MDREPIGGSRGRDAADLRGRRIEKLCRELAIDRDRGGRHAAGPAARCTVGDTSTISRQAASSTSRDASQAAVSTSRSSVYAFTAPIALDRLVSGVIELKTLTGVASPRGDDTTWNAEIRGDTRAA